MFPHGLTFCRWCGGTTCVRFGRPRSRGVDRVDLSPRDQWFKHVRYFWVKWRWLNAADFDTWKLLERWILIERTPMVAKPDRAIRPPTLPDQIWRQWSIVPHDRDQTVPSPELQSDDLQDSWKNSTIAVRSNRDRGAIEPRSWNLRCWIASTRSRRRPTEI